MKNKIVVSTALALALIASPLVYVSNAVVAKEQLKTTQTTKIKLTDDLVVKLASQWAKTESYLQRGGDYKEGEYKTFQYQGKTYRFLSSDIDTRKEMYHYVRKTLTLEEAAVWYKNNGLIEFEGKLAQLEADGGSILDWEKATAEFVTTDNKTFTYRIIVPVGETEQKSMYMIGLEQEKTKWKVNKIPYLDLDIPFNINPAFQFLNHLLTNEEVAQEQFIDYEGFAADFRKGVAAIEVREVKKVWRGESQVEYVVDFYAKLHNNYNGYLSKGTNQLYFLIQQTDEMEFKIVSVGTEPHLQE